MNIAVFIKATTYHKGFGGLETLNKNLCEGMAARGHTVTVFSPKRDFEQSEVVENNVKYIFVDSVYRTLFQSFNKNNWYRRSVEVFEKYHSRDPFNLVVTQSSAGLSILKKHKEYGVKTVGISHGSMLSELQTRYSNMRGIKDLYQLTRDTAFGLFVFFGRQREFLFNSDKVVAVSNFVKKSLVEETYCPENYIEVIHNGSDFYSKIPAGKSVRSGGKFLYIGQIFKEKGVDILPRLLAEPGFENFSIDIIGSGDYLDQLKSQAANERIRIHGKVSYEQIPGWFFTNDVFLFPTRRVEGFPMVLIEAMFAGMPIVAYSMGGVSDAIVDGKTGFLIEPGNYNDFRSKALELMRNTSLRESMAREAVAIANREYRLDKMLDKYENLFKKLVKG